MENIDLTVPDGISIEDPVRMYLKEMERCLLSAEEEIDLAQRMESGDEARSVWQATCVWWSALPKDMWEEGCCSWI